MKQKSGFTVIEILFVLIITIVTTILVVTQINSAEATMRDKERKAAINAMYFQLINVYYKQNNYYPETISPELLTGMDPALFTDPRGILMGDAGASYTYQASDCIESQCQKFKLTATLEKEAPYIKGNWGSPVSVGTRRSFLTAWIILLIWLTTFLGFLTKSCS